MSRLQAKPDAVLDPNSLVNSVVDDTYRLLRFIGQGAFGYVFEAEEILLGEAIGRCAVKLVRCTSAEETRAFQSEVRALASIDHPNIIRFRGARQLKDGLLKDCLCLCMELADESLEHFLEVSTPTAAEIRDIALAIAQGLNYLHSRPQPVVHRDIKPGNIFRQGNSWKLGDLGLTQTMNRSASLTSSRRGTLHYASPELLRGEVGTFCDVWAFGILLHELVSGQALFQSLSDAEIVTRIVTGQMPLSTGLPAPFDAIAAGCLSRDRHLRWTMDRVQAALAAPLAQPVAPPQPTVAMPSPPATSACTHCGAATPLGSPLCCLCGRMMGQAVDAGYLAVKYRLGRDLLDKGYLPEALRHFQQILAAAPGYADVAQRIAEIENQMRATVPIQSKMVLEPLFDDYVNAIESYLGGQVLQFLPCGQLVFANSRHSGEANVYLGALQTKTRLRRVMENKLLAVDTLVVSPSSQLLASAHKNHIRLWELASETEVGRFEVPEIKSLAFTQDGSHLLATGSNTLSIHVASGQVATLAAPASKLYCSALSPGGGQMLYLTGNWLKPGGIELWDLHSGTVIKALAGDTLKGPISLSETMLAAATDLDDTVSLFDMRAGELLTMPWVDANGYVVRDVNVKSLSLHPAGTHLAAGLWSQNQSLSALQIRETTGGQVIWADPQVRDVACASFSTDGRHFAAVGCFDGVQRHKIRVWEVRFL